MVMVHFPKKRTKIRPKMFWKSALFFSNHTTSYYFYINDLLFDLKIEWHGQYTCEILWYSCQLLFQCAVDVNVMFNPRKDISIRNELHYAGSNKKNNANLRLHFYTWTIVLNPTKLWFPDRFFFFLYFSGDGQQ